MENCLCEWVIEEAVFNLFNLLKLGKTVGNLQAEVNCEGGYQELELGLIRFHGTRWRLRRWCQLQMSNEPLQILDRQQA